MKKVLVIREHLGEMREYTFQGGMYIEEENG